MRVEKFLEASAERFPGKTVLVVGARRITYAELDAQANRLAHALRKRGVNRGDRVVIFQKNTIEAVVSIFATLKADAIFCVVNASTKADKLAYILGNCRAKAVLTQAEIVKVAATAVEQSPSVAFTMVAGLGGQPATPFLKMEDEIAASPAEKPLQQGIDHDLAMIIYTSGSTGFPKGVMMTHANIVTAATSITTYLENKPEDIVLSVLPLSFDYGLYQAIMVVKFGGTLILEESFAFPQLILNKLAAEKVTGLPLVPTAAAILLQMRDLKPGSFPHLQYITNTAAALPPAHIERLQELFPTARIYSMYGLTECKRCTYLPPSELKRRPGSVGKAIPNTEVYVVDSDGKRVGPGVVGELVIRGEHVMQGYWENQAATDKCLRPGENPWEKVLYSGDLFKTDEEGFLYFVGRKDDIIKTRGEKVSPKEVENVLYALPGVREAAVVGVPDGILGMAIKAVIVQAAGAELTEAAVRLHCVQHLEDFMVPKFVEFRAELPKTDTGKIRRSQVQNETMPA